jgi:hypothetical protein
MRKLLGVIALFSCVLVSAGCWPLFLVGAGGAGVYATSKDIIQGDTDVSFESVWDAAMTVSKVRGAIKKQDFDKGSIEVLEGKARVWITIEKLTQATTHLRVASRKYKMPNLELAQIYYTKIIDQAKLAVQR